MKPPIRILLDHNEKGSPRANALSSIVDKRFAAIDYHDLAVDCAFAHNDFEQYFLVEFKEPADYVSSVFSGHLYDQCLTMRELTWPCMVLITGEWSEVMKANRDSCIHRGAKDQIASNYLRLKSFKKRALLQGIHIFSKGDDSGFF